MTAEGASVTSIAFPRYGESVHADLVREFHVVDLDDNGRLTRTEMKDWIGPIDVASR